MLIRFEVSNYRSIADPVELSMVAVDRDRDAARKVDSLGECLLTVAAIYGPNASGKTNVVAALGWLRDAVRSSVRFWEDEIPLEPFAFSDPATTNSEFVVEFTVDEVRFEYVLELNRERVEYEGLFHYPEKKRRRIFERERNELKVQRGLGGISGTRELLTDRVLALSVARRFNEPLVTEFSRQLLGTQTFGIPSWIGGLRTSARPIGSRSSLSWFDGSPTQPTLFNIESASGFGDRSVALAMLRLADLGIEDVLIENQEIASAESPEPYSRRRVRLLHKSGDTVAPLEYAAESEGTRTWFHLIGPVLSALKQGSLVVFDELDASLHPTLTSELVRIFHSSSTNPLGAQLLFTSHDTSLLNYLNRDEVWLTEKRRDGSTRLGALAEFAGERVRKSQNLENAYLHGRFGAIPQLDHADLLRALRLIG